MTIRNLTLVALVALIAACGPPQENNGNNGTDGNNGTNNNGTNNNGTNGNAGTNSATNNGTNANAGTNNTAGTNNGGDVSFADDIVPLVTANCNKAGCHAAPGQGAFAIDGDTAADLQAAWDGVEASSSDNLLIDPSSPSTSEVYIRITGMARTQMPLGADPLADSEVDLIEAWIAAGAPFDS